MFVCVFVLGFSEQLCRMEGVGAEAQTPVRHDRFRPRDSRYAPRPSSYRE